MKVRTDIISHSHEMGEADIYHNIPQTKTSLQSWVRTHSIRSQSRGSDFTGVGRACARSCYQHNSWDPSRGIQVTMGVLGTDRGNKKLLSTKEQRVHRPGGGGHKVSLGHWKQSSIAGMPRARGGSWECLVIHSSFHWSYCSLEGRAVSTAHDSTDPPIIADS